MLSTVFKCICASGVALLAVSPFVRSASSQMNQDWITTFRGDCRFRLFGDFLPCDESASLIQFSRGYGVVVFTNANGSLLMSGSADRQPNLQNYYLSIDTFGIMAGEDQLIDEGMEGECHFNLNRDATEFYFVKCDIYNREKGLMHSFYLENIRDFNRRVMPPQ